MSGTLGRVNITQFSAWENSRRPSGVDGCDVPFLNFVYRFVLFFWFIKKSKEQTICISYRNLGIFPRGYLSFLPFFILVINLSIISIYLLFSYYILVYSKPQKRINFMTREPIHLFAVNASLTLSPSRLFIIESSQIRWRTASGDFDFSCSSC